eukprot:TRINITY_DN30295_c0_g1_i2.p1 TRINITY_DN30295_c0_g1~~TRINITY_DN30295_c0_g1_i2.p1  ORF type:complete len:696 (+),score=259.37 TRINITY_DN30295_c0_g1_i2:226-2313(+)
MHRRIGSVSARGILHSQQGRGIASPAAPSPTPVTSTIPAAGVRGATLSVAAAPCSSASLPSALQGQRRFQSSTAEVSMPDPPEGIAPIPAYADVKFDPARNLREYAGLNGGQILEKKLREYGVTHIFGFTGGAILPVTDAFYGSPIKFINNASEQCSGHCAEGFSKAGGGMTTGIAMATSGPGVTNLVTPLQDALTDSVPMIAFVGQVPTAAVGTDAFQECPTCDITAPCTKWNYQVKRIEEFPDVIDRAFYMAHSGKKGPVLIDLPKDVMVQTLNPSTGYKNEKFLCPAIEPPQYEAESIPNLQAIADMINAAERPVIVAGQGATDAWVEVREMMDKNIPTTTTLHAMGIVDEAHPLGLKMLGMHGAAYSNYAVQEADVIIALGYRFDDRTTGRLDQYAPEARKAERHNKGGIIQIEIEHRQINKVVRPTYSVLGDAKQVLQHLLPRLEKKPRTAWLEKVAADRAAHPLKWVPHQDPTKIKVQEVIHGLNAYLEEVDRAKDVIWTTGVGNHQMMTCQFVQWRWPRRMMSSGSLGTMGVGVPYAVGAQIAQPHRTVICVDGDASFMMTCNDLRTMAEHNIPVKVAIMNDFKQQMVNIWQAIYFNKRFLVTDSYNPDFCKLAEAYGIKTLRVGQRSELQDGIKEFIDYNEGPVIADFRVQPDMCTPMVCPGAALDDMILNPEEVLRLEGDATNVPG